MRVLGRGIALVATMILLMSIATADAKATPPMTDWQREAAQTIRDITLQLILIAVGVFSLAGAFLVRKEASAPAAGRWFLFSAFLFLATSVVAGYLVHGAMIFQLSEGIFDPNSEAVRWPAIGQAVLFFAGGVLFMWFIFKNVR